MKEAVAQRYYADTAVKPEKEIDRYDKRCESVVAFATAERFESL